MKENVATPITELQDTKGNNRSMWWKCYFYLMALMTVLSFPPIIADSNSGVVDYFSLAVTVFTN